MHKLLQTRAIDSSSVTRNINSFVARQQSMFHSRPGSNAMKPEVQISLLLDKRG